MLPADYGLVIAALKYTMACQIFMGYLSLVSLFTTGLELLLFKT